MADALTAVRAAITDFKLTQEALREFGAEDTEPDHNFHAVIRAALQGRSMPTSWELYSVAGSWLAEAQLTAKARAVYDLIRTLTVAELPEAVKFLQGYAWRVDF